MPQVTVPAGVSTYELTTLITDYSDLRLRVVSSA